MSKFVIAITGPTASGKSTVAKHLSKGINRCVNIDVDYVKHFVASPFIYDSSDEGVEQWRLLGSNVGSSAEKYQKAGYNVIINGYLSVDAWKSLLSHVKLSHRVLLTLDVAKNEKRDVGRSEESIMGKGWVKKHHKFFSEEPFFRDFVLIDSTNHKVEDTVTEIARLLGQNWGEL